MSAISERARKQIARLNANVQPKAISAAPDSVQVTGLFISQNASGQSGKTYSTLVIVTDATPGIERASFGKTLKTYCGAHAVIETDPRLATVEGKRTLLLPTLPSSDNDPAAVALAQTWTLAIPLGGMLITRFKTNRAATDLPPLTPVVLKGVTSKFLPPREGKDDEQRTPWLSYDELSVVPGDRPSIEAAIHACFGEFYDITHQAVALTNPVLLAVRGRQLAASRIDKMGAVPPMPELPPLPDWDATSPEFYAEFGEDAGLSLRAPDYMLFNHYHALVHGFVTNARPGDEWAVTPQIRGENDRKTESKWFFGGGLGQNSRPERGGLRHMCVLAMRGDMPDDCGDDALVAYDDDGNVLGAALYYYLSAFENSTEPFGIPYAMAVPSVASAPELEAMWTMFITRGRVALIGTIESMESADTLGIKKVGGAITACALNVNLIDHARQCGLRVPHTCLDAVFALIKEAGVAFASGPKPVPAYKYGPEMIGQTEKALLLARSSHNPVLITVPSKSVDDIAKRPGWAINIFMGLSTLETAVAKMTESIDAFTAEFYADGPVKIRGHKSRVLAHATALAAWFSAHGMAYTGPDKSMDDDDDRWEKVAKTISEHPALAITRNMCLARDIEPYSPGAPFLTSIGLALAPVLKHLSLFLPVLVYTPPVSGKRAREADAVADALDAQDAVQTDAATP